MKRIAKSIFFYPLLLTLLTIIIYYPLFINGKIPFPGDLMVASYSPWFDYYKIPVKNPLISDVFSQLYIWKSLAIENIQSGQWPLWNPYSFIGNPLLANYQSATLYPLNILILIPNKIGWGLFIFLQTLLSALSMYLLLSVWLKQRLSRIAGALIFSLGGLMTTWVELGTAGHSMIWLPLSFYSVEKFFTLRQLRYIILFTISLALSILSGNAQITTYTFLFIFLFIVFRTWVGIKTKSITNSLLLISGVFLSLGITALQLLPSFDLLQKSIRTSDSYIQGSNYGLLPWNDFLKFFVADFYGNPVTGNYWGFLNYFETGSFLGTSTLVLLIYAYFYLTSTNIIKFFQISFLVVLILLFDNPISHYIYNSSLPFLTSSYASRIIFIIVFISSILSAFSVNQMLTQKEPLKILIKPFVWALSFFIGITGGLIITRLILKWYLNHVPISYYEIYSQSFSSSLINLNVALKNSLIPLTIIIILVLVIIIISKNNLKFLGDKKKFLIVLFIIFVLFIDLGRYFLKFNPFVPKELFYPTTPTLDYLQKQPGIFRIGREQAAVLPPNTWTTYHLQSFEGYDPLYFEEYSRYMNLLNGGSLRETKFSRYAELSNSYSSPYLDLINVKYFVTILKDQSNHIPGYKLIFQNRGSAILENSKALDRVFFAKSYIVVSKEQTNNLFSSKSSFNPKEIVLLEEDLFIPNLTGTGAIEIMNYQPSFVNIKTQTKQEELLVLSDQFDEGWHAKIDNQETNVLKADFLLRAIKVPSGNHNIIFYYWPDSFDLGLKISILSLFILIFATVISIKKKCF